MQTIQNVLDALTPDDNRRDFWNKMRELIRDRMFNVVMARLISHKDDVDFAQQVLVVSNEIAIRGNSGYIIHAHCTESEMKQCRGNVVNAFPGGVSIQMYSGK